MTYQQLLSQHTPDRQGRIWFDCPHCRHGKKRKVSGLYQRDGKWLYHCFICRANKLKMPKEWTPPPLPAQKPKTYRWQAHAEELANRWYYAEDAQKLWQQYKPITPQQRHRHRLGVGVSPASQCKHRRLTVPIYLDGTICGFRTRSFECECISWLTPGGSKVWLYNYQSIKAGELLVVTENPIDAILMTARGYRTVATLGVSNWKPEYTEMVKVASTVIIMFDNDLPGNGGGKRHGEFASEWKAKRGASVPEPNGVRLANRLRKSGVKAVLYQWPRGSKHGADIGDLLKG